MREKLKRFFFKKYDFLNVLSKKKWFSKKFDSFIDEVLAQRAENYVDYLFSKIRFISSEEYADMLYDFSEFFLSEYSEKDTLLCATAAQSDKDSSQEVLYDITVNIAALSNKKYQTCNRYDKASGVIKDLAKKGQIIKRVLLVDEFFGSGVTASGRVKSLKQHLVDKRICVDEVSFFVIASHVNSYKLIKNNVDVKFYYAYEILDNVISSIDDEHERDVYYYLNYIWCRLFSESFEDFKLPDLGYGDCEVSYYRENGSCPNNVLPIVWWPNLHDETWREPIFPRYI